MTAEEQHGAWLGYAEIATMLNGDQDAILLLAFLRAHNGPWSTFMVANGLTETFRWPTKRLAAARERLIELGHLERVRRPANGRPALYRWGE
jgi:hypothetical protein